MIISGGGVVMGGGVDAVVHLAEALKASKCFDGLIPIRLGNYSQVAKLLDTPPNGKNLFRLQCAQHTFTMTLSPAHTPNGWDLLATKAARQQ